MHDVAVIGGGPGGSTAAALLGAAGRDVVVFERERFPRFHIGESLLPWNMRIFERLGLVEVLEAGFIEKWGVEFVSSSGDLSRTYHFDNALDVRYPKCFEVQRARFDRLLLDNAARRGARVRQGTKVLSAQRRPDGVWEIEVESEERGAERAEARFLVDASGRDAFLARRDGLKVPDPLLKKAAFFAHYRGIPRAPGRDAGNIVVVMMKDGWFWFIPFADGTTSVGLVTDGSSVRSAGLRPQEALEEGIRRCPAARRLTEKAERITEVWSASDWSYRCRRIAGDGWLLVGDAAAFVDPVFSSGVLLAMSSGEAAADLLDEALTTGSLDPARSRRYEKTVLRHVAGYRRIVGLFYTPAFAQLCLVPKERFSLPGAVLSLLAGHMDHGWSVRWRLEVFYALGWIFRHLGAGPPIDLHTVFESRDALPAARGAPAA